MRVQRSNPRVGQDRARHMRPRMRDLARYKQCFASDHTGRDGRTRESRRYCPDHRRPYRKLVTDKVGAQSGTGKKRSWKKIIVEKRSIPRRATTSGRRGTKPVSCATSDDICNCPMCGEHYSDPPTGLGPV